MVSIFQISVSQKDYQLPSTELLRRHKIQRKPIPEYDYIMLDKTSLDKCQKSTGNLKVGNKIKQGNSNSIRWNSILMGGSLC